MPFRPDDGCVFSGDLTLVKDVKLRKLIYNGPKFRLQSADQPLTCLEQSLDSFISKICSRNKGVDKSQFLAWKTELLREATMTGQNKPCCARRVCLRRSLVFSKSYSVFLLSCLRIRLPTIPFLSVSVSIATSYSETQRSDGAYHGVPDSAESIIERHTLSLRRFGLTPDNNLPFLFWLPKMHKSPPSHRFISASGKCSTANFWHVCILPYEN